MEKPILDPPMPYIGPIIYGGKFGPGKMVRIQGTIPSVAYRFDINLQCGPETHPRDDVVLQLSARLLDGYICLNSLQSGIWGEEQRHISVPLKRAESFEVIVMCDYNQYKVAINGQHYCEFPQRIHYDRITHLTIDGDVSIIQITYEGAAGTGSVGEPKRLPEDDFELVDVTGVKTPPPGLHRPPEPGFSIQPPPYQSVNPYALNSPYPTGGVPNVAPYPPAAPYPTGIPGIITRSHIPPPGAPGIPPPPIGAPIPLNAATSNFRTVSRKYENRWCFCVGLAVIIAFGMFVMLLSGLLVR